MGKTLTADPQAELSAEEVTDHKAAIAEIFAQMDQIDERIKRNQAETEQLRAKTRVRRRNNSEQRRGCCWSR